MGLYGLTEPVFLRIKARLMHSNYYLDIIRLPFTQKEDVMYIDFDNNLNFHRATEVALEFEIAERGTAVSKYLIQMYIVSSMASRAFGMPPERFN